MRLSNKAYVAGLIFICWELIACQATQPIVVPESMIYQQAIEQITQSEAFSLQAQASTHFAVSGELVNFFAIGGFFRQEMKTYLNLDEAKLMARRDVTQESEKKPQLKKLGTRKRAKIRLYLSRVEQGMFAIEMMRLKDRKRLPFPERPVFGSSNLYLFEIDTLGMVKLVSTMEMTYN